MSRVESRAALAHISRPEWFLRLGLFRSTATAIIVCPLRNGDGFSTGVSLIVDGVDAGVVGEEAGSDVEAVVDWGWSDEE